MTIFILHNNEQIPHPLIDAFHFEHGENVNPKELRSGSVIMQWGTGDFSSELKLEWVLNGKEGLMNCSPQIWRELLPLNGISVGHERESYQKRYLIFQFQLKTIGIYTDTKDVWLSSEMETKRKYREISLNNKAREVRKVKEWATRTIHALGLDFGMVCIGVNNKKYTVYDLSPTPLLLPKIITRLGEEMIEFAKIVQYQVDPKQIVLGADPEFVLRHRTTGNFILASHFFRKEGEVGCDQIWIRGDKTRSKLPIAELRPQPSSEPRELVLSIYKGLLKASEIIKNSKVQFLAGSTPLRGYPIGGHIHFSNISLNSFFLRALDNYLTLPFFLLEDPRGLRRRPRYGFIGDFRHQPHGGFEYRSLPSWLVSPRVTKGAIALAKVVAGSYPRLRLTPLSHPAVQKAFYQGRQDLVLNVVKHLWSDLEAQPLYREYRQYLDPLKESIFSSGRWNELNDIRQRWKIPPFS